MKKTPLKPFSKKRQAQMREYTELIKTLRHLCENKSELSGQNPDWQSRYLAEPHHIDKRNGGRLLDPFGIIMLTRFEHDRQECKINGQKPVSDYELYRIVLPLRISQGFKPQNGGSKF